MRSEGVGEDLPGERANRRHERSRILKVSDLQDPIEQEEVVWPEVSVHDARGVTVMDPLE
jgi:hypothetical protein